MKSSSPEEFERNLVQARNVANQLVQSLVVPVLEELEESRQKSAKNATADKQRGKEIQKSVVQGAHNVGQAKTEQLRFEARNDGKLPINYTPLTNGIDVDISMER